MAGAAGPPGLGARLVNDDPDEGPRGRRSAVAFLRKRKLPPDIVTNRTGHRLPGVHRNPNSPQRAGPIVTAILRIAADGRPAGAAREEGMPGQ
jgi:hypothetical protein